MKRFVLVMIALALVAPDLAAAQQQQQGQHRPPPRPVTKPAPGSERPVRPNRPIVRPPTTKPAPGFERPVGRPIVRPPHRPIVRPPTTKPAPGYERPVGRPPHRPGFRPPHRPGFRPPNFRPIRGPAFRYPRGYAYRRWSIGLFLPSLFLASAYQYGNYAALGVGPPPRGYRWVRYGPDLLLVNIRTRRIADVVRGAFY